MKRHKFHILGRSRDKYDSLYINRTDHQVCRRLPATAGLMDGGLKALRQLGHERQMEHFAGVDDQFQQDPKRWWSVLNGISP